MIDKKKRLQRIGTLAAACLTAATILFTCEPVPPYCSKVVLYDPDHQFCFGGKAHNLCNGYSYNPLTEGCAAGLAVGTKCAGGSVVKLGDPCDGYTLTLGVAPENGGGSVVGSDIGKTNYDADHPVTLVAMPEQGHDFIGWAGAQNSPDPVLDVKMDGNKSLIAMFSPTPAPGKQALVAIAFPKEGGSISVTANGNTLTEETTTHDNGANVTVTASPNSGYKFNGWAGTSTYESASATFTMDGSKTLVAMFTPDTFTLTVNATPEGGGIVYVNTTARTGTTVKIDAGTTIVATAEPEDGYSFAGWEWDAADEAVVAGNVITIRLTRGNVTLTAKFREGGGEVVPPDTTVTKDTTVTDVSTVTISGLTWMKENLNIETADSWCYNDTASYCEKYGRLYTWEAAYSACASLGGGWRLPSNEDWDNLVDYAGGYSVAGKKLKATSGWNNYDGASGNGTDNYEFSALPGGYRGYVVGGFSNAGYDGYWWSATEYDAGIAYGRGMSYNYDYVYEHASSKSHGFSVRCIGGS